MTEPTPTPIPTPAPAPTPAPTPTPAPAAFDWKTAGLSEIHTGVVQNKGWKGPGDLVESYVNLEKLAKGDPNTLLRIPADNDPAAQNEFFTKLGRPGKPEEYTFKAPDGADPKFADNAKQWFHEAGIPDKAATKIVEKWNAHAAQTVAAAKTAAETASAAEAQALKTEWGATYDARVALIDKAAQVFGMTEAQLLSLKATMGTKGAMTFLHNLGSRLGVDDNFVRGDVNRGFNAASPAGAKARIAELSADKAWGKRFMASDADALREWGDLHKIAYGQG